MSEHSPTATRRSALGLAVGLLGLSVSGCDIQGLDPRDPIPAPDSDGTPPSTPDPDADIALVAEVVASIVARTSLVDAVRRRHRGLRRELAPLARMHATHLDVLDPQGTERALSEAVTPATSRQAADRQRLVRAERALVQQVARAAERAEAGQVAKLLASVSASIGQHLAALEGPRS